MGLMKFAKVAIRNLFSKPVTTNYPFEPAVYPERSRGRILLDKEKCILCGLCSMHCPTGTIVIDRKAGTWTMNRFDCVQCANCVNVCPKSALSIVPGYFTPNVEKIIETNQVKEPSDGKSKDPKPAAQMDRCKLCGICAKKCPQNAITVDRFAKTWSVNEAICVSCGACANACPFKAITMGGKPVERKAAPKAAPVAAAKKATAAAPAAAKTVSVPAASSACILCGACAGQCPASAITVGDSWSVDASACLSCGACVSTCPVNALSMTEVTVSAAPEAPAAEEPKQEKAPAAGGKSVPQASSECILCGACASQCPASAISTDGSWSVDAEACLSCGACVSTCPVNALSMMEAAAPAAAAPQQEEQPKAKPTGRRVYIPQYDQDGEEIPVPACTKPDYVDEWADLPVSDPESCIYCGLCSKKCPKSAITVDTKEKVWEVDNAECVRCGICVEVCPKKCMTLPDVTLDVPEPEKDFIIACLEPEYNEQFADLPQQGEECIYCTLCAKKCPKGALTVDRNAQTWAVDNQECVRCGICAEVCPKQCITLPDVGLDVPEVEEEEPDFIIACLEPEYNEQFADLPQQGDGCIYCTLCAKKCPKGALTVDRNAKTWAVDNEACVRCGVCAEVCPKKCITL